MRKLLLLLTSLLLIAHSGSALAEDTYDPIEPVNRGVFWFNEKFDYYLLEPVSEGYDFVMPDEAQVGVTNFFKNLRYPTYFLSSLAQGKIEQAVEQTGRFLINSTVGLLGLIDVAEDVGLKDTEEDFGLVFASYGIPKGPYIMLPILGPSNLRDTVGLILDTVTSPTFIFSMSNAESNTKFWVSTGTYSLKAVQTRVNLADAIKAGHEGSLDYYLFLQSSYDQYRQGLIDRDKEGGSEDKLNIDQEVDELLGEEVK